MCSGYSLVLWFSSKRYANLLLGHDHETMEPSICLSISIVLLSNSGMFLDVSIDNSSREQSSYH